MNHFAPFIGVARVGCLAAAFAVVGCSTITPGAESYLAPSLGSTWVNARRDTGSYGSASVELRMTRGERTWEGRRLISFDTAESTLLTTLDGAYVAQVKGDTLLVSWEPEYNLQWPLEVGKSWTKPYRMTIHGSKRTVSYELNQRIEAYEDVTVPAGTFKAFRVRSSDTLGNENTIWISPEIGIFLKQSLRRTEKHAQGPGTREMEVVSISIKK
jgi:hypothetical protein